MHKLRDANLHGKRVLYRPDYNVPIKKGEIHDTFRITATYPTLDFLMEQGAKIIIASHLGRPDGQIMEEFSLRPVAEELANHYHGKARVQMASQIFSSEVDSAIANMHGGDILVLPNVRFFEGEETNNEAFGHQLSDLADVFVLDAFACAHRAHSSIVAPAKYLPSYPGFLMEKELEHLGQLVGEPVHPFVVIMGGAKVSDKIEMMQLLGEKADTILVGGAMANTFLLAQGENIGDSLVERDKRMVAESLIHTLGVKLFLAPDYVKDGEGDHVRFLDIGQKAVTQFKEHMADAKLIFWNGSLGYTEEAPYDKGSTAIAEYLAERTAAGVTTIIAGGDTVDLVTKLNLHDKLTFVSTGGGAALEFLSGKELPGVAALNNATL
jgi:phosphoglycerate kinase